MQNMFTPEESQRTSVVHYRPSVIFNPSNSEKSGQVCRNSINFSKESYFDENYQQNDKHCFSKVKRENEGVEEMRMYNYYGSSNKWSSHTNDIPIQSESCKRWQKISEGSYSDPSEDISFKSESPKSVKSENSYKVKEKAGNKPKSNCHVCGDRAVAHMHYGGVCCYSCKAFFRRATQTGKDKKYCCKRDRRCLVTHSNRKSCQYCR